MGNTGRELRKCVLYSVSSFKKNFVGILEVQCFFSIAPWIKACL